MVSVFCCECQTKITSIRSEERPDKSTTTQHILIKNRGYCSKCDKTVEITTKVSS